MLQPQTEALAVRASPGAGRGVFARRSFEVGDVIERCPVVVVPPEDTAAVQRTALCRYTIEWGDGIALALGFGSLYNHSRTPNAGWQPLHGDLLIELTAHESIRAGDEVKIDYTGGGGDIDLGFTPVPS